jgi:hypothetical protein
MQIALCSNRSSTAVAALAGSFSRNPGSQGSAAGGFGYHLPSTWNGDIAFLKRGQGWNMAVIRFRFQKTFGWNQVKTFLAIANARWCDPETRHVKSPVRR